MTKELKNRILENKVLTHDERMEIIKALEIVEEFEKAQIITGGRLNGRTYAYKCGLEDGKRKAPEQQPSEDCVDRNHVIATISQHHFDKDKDSFDLLIHNLCKEVNELPPVAPARKAPREDITEDEVKINMLELAFNQAKEHAEGIEVLTDNHRLIFKAEKRGNQVGWSSLEISIAQTLKGESNND